VFQTSRDCSIGFDVTTVAIIFSEVLGVLHYSLATRYEEGARDRDLTHDGTVADREGGNES